MPKIFYIEPHGYHTPLLFDTFKEIFSLNGYGETNDVEEADIAFVDLYSWVRPILSEQFRVALRKLIPMAFFDLRDYGGMSREIFVHKLYDEYNAYGLKSIVFIRKMDRSKQYPSYVYPIEHITEYDFPLVSKEQLFNREYDVCFIGNTSPQRQSVVNGLIDAGLKVDIHWTNEKGKLPHDEWINRHRNAKMFLSADGGGFSDERIYQLGTIGVILKQKNNQLQTNPFKHGYDCREISEVPTEYEIEHLKKFLTTPRAMYSTYLKGAAKLKNEYSPEYRANYILSILKQNGL